jgi:hypothetical protein
MNPHKQNEIPVNWGRLLESQLLTWQGGSQHPKGIGEYITNSDDSYRRLKKFEGQKIFLTIYSRRGKMIDKLIIEDYAEGMSHDDLENKFFQYFYSFSGRDRGEKVTGKFGTGGKAYAIMNFRHCWIMSRKDGKECKAWFKWDGEQKSILYGYNKGGYIDKITNEPNDTTVMLEDSLQVKSNLEELANLIAKSTRNSHVLKNQEVSYVIYRKNQKFELILSYQEPLDENASKIWEFPLPPTLIESPTNGDILKIKFYEQPLSDDKNIIDVSDGISSVANYRLKDIDGRLFAKHLFGNITVSKLYSSLAVKENRKGLEEGDDLTVELEAFLEEKINKIVDEIEVQQKVKEKVQRQEEANKKLNEFSKFLNKQNLNFKLQLNELKKKFSITDEPSEQPDPEPEDGDTASYRKPIPEDPDETKIKGRWIYKSAGESSGGTGKPEFIPDIDGEDEAVRVDMKQPRKFQPKAEERGLQVLMSNDESNPDSPILSEYEEPIVDRDLERKGIIWVNSLHPIIKANRENKNTVVFLETVSNFVLVVIAQYFAQKELEVQPESELEAPLIIFRKHYFKLHKDIHMDDTISYFEKE